MADIAKTTDGPAPDNSDSFDFTRVPDYDNDFVDEEGIVAFAQALAAPDPSPSQDDLLSPVPKKPRSLFITALNDWKPVRQRVRKRRRQPRRGKDETREGYVYSLAKWPLLFTVLGWIIFLGASYFVTRFYIYLYEHWITWRGKRQKLRAQLKSRTSYEDWVKSAKELDAYLGNTKWTTQDDYAYYDSRTLRRVKTHLKETRKRAEDEEHDALVDGTSSMATTPGRELRPIQELRRTLEACIKNNFAGFENPRLYSETYYGTKNLLQGFVDELEASLSLMQRTNQLPREEKREFFKHVQTNYGQSALCLSGGAGFAYYHFGVAKALLDADLLPDVITGTSGGALIAALLCTRTNEELKKILVPALAARINACHEGVFTWVRRWWRTGARFDSVDWACLCSWFTRGSLTFREAYERTGRILNVTCVPSDPHTPAILANYLTSPDCVIWSAVLASAAVPGILNPVVLMKKVKYMDPKDGMPRERLEPYSFGHKWKDGSLRTDIPLTSLNLHFNVNFPIVSQVNPHVNLFFFSSRGSVGNPVTHRKGRGWRGGYLGSAIEQYLKLDLTKWLKVLRHLELLPRPMGQDWSEIWLQRFSGTITIWPKAVSSDFYYILTDPTPKRLARMIHFGQLSVWPKLLFIGNRMKIQRLIEKGRRTTRPARPRADGTDYMEHILSEDDVKGVLRDVRKTNGSLTPNLLGGDGTREQPVYSSASSDFDTDEEDNEVTPPDDAERLVRGDRELSPTISERLGGWWRSLSPSSPGVSDGLVPDSSIQARVSSTQSLQPIDSAVARDTYSHHRPSSMFELRRPAAGSQEARLGDDKRLWEAMHAYGEAQNQRRGSFVDELSRQSMVFFDDDDDVEGMATDAAEFEPVEPSVPETAAGKQAQGPRKPNGRRVDAQMKGVLASLKGSGRRRANKTD